ncbi:pyridoxamine 5'-phosphate oxidase family protein [Kitasatospora atroaurantiaca]|uniref:Nitroimidazol reductase NimA-like FMN-containing flavoprotein (Pyridoxamine 5'-phosphate oxidase superfamily) n=1 Tax=Kitasatospora atroaurantiaca TaxID=285545 RepID=A0A561EZM7_9ACTN|nr:pyridoxamine 5'-phosphate oxidase family protein [Kitasatospora atroaurantiaca]TWE21064.1 nitroimidazol reductase NimA-like FMN-containing flavoprotein (pyridoxamine 5'-phosphate oxidase superfamily) [Kitasatospora atroaurantiaca]
MNENSAPSGESDRAAARPGDVARRIALRSQALGLSDEQVAKRAGMSPRYLQHLEELESDFDPGALLRVAAALQMTYRELLEGHTDPPPGQTSAAPHPVLMQLTTPECWDRLGEHGIGRVALSGDAGPAVLPVNYIVDDGTIVYRTTPDSMTASAAGSEVAFEVDHVDEHLSQGWSVLIVGTAEYITDPETVRRLAEEPEARPWAGGARNLWIRIAPTRITGRRISTV